MKQSSIRLKTWAPLVLIAALAVVAAGAIYAGGDSEDGGKAFLGVHIEEETAHTDGGARVTRVVTDSAAAEAGFREGDIIQSVDGEPVRGPRGLGARLGDREPGDQVTITVNRDGQDLRLDVELGDQSDALDLHFGHDWDSGKWEEFGERWAEHGEHWAEYGEHWAEWGEQFGERMEQLGERLGERFGDAENWQHYSHSFGGAHRPRLGVQLVEPTAELREHLGSDGSSGVLVAKVIEETPAEEAGIEVGDLIVAVDGDEISDAGDLVRALRERAGQQFDVDVIRDGRSVSVDVILPEEEDDADGPNVFFFAPRAPEAPAVFVMPAPVVPIAPVAPLFPVPPAAPTPPRPPKAAPVVVANHLLDSV